MEKRKVQPIPKYEQYADDPFYLFLKKETWLLDVPHYHDSMELIYLIEGTTKIHVGGSIQHLEKGDIFFCNPQLVHFYENDSTPKLAMCMVLSNKYTHDFRHYYKNALLPTILKDKEKNQQIYQILSTWFDTENRTFLMDCAFANLVLDKIISLYNFADTQSKGSMNSLAIAMINYILEHYHENISLETAATHFGYSKEYFSKVFKQTVGKNFLSFLNTTRTQKALDLMQNSDDKKSIHEICVACGFNNPTSLYRNLKRVENYANLFDKE